MGVVASAQQCGGQAAAREQGGGRNGVGAAPQCGSGDGVRFGAALIRLTGPPRVTRDSLTVLHRNLISRARSDCPTRQAAGPRRL